MILKRRKREKFGTREETRVRCPAHLAWLRGFPCLVADPGYIDGPCDSRIQAAHVRRGTDGAMAVKPSDCHTVPLCNWHHAEQHQIGESAFELKYSVTLIDCAAHYWQMSPHRHRYEQRQRARAEI